MHIMHFPALTSQFFELCLFFMSLKGLPICQPKLSPGEFSRCLELFVVEPQNAYLLQS